APCLANAVVDCRKCLILCSHGVAPLRDEVLICLLRKEPLRRATYPLDHCATIAMREHGFHASLSRSTPVIMTPIEDTNPPACQRLQALAERDPRRAVPLARRALEALPTSDPLVQAWARYTLGWALLCWERFDEARPHLQAAQEAFEVCGASLGVLH